MKPNDGPRPGEWERLGSSDPTALEPARREIHGAMQLVDALGRERVPSDDRWHHIAMSWSRDRRALIGARAHAGYRLGLSISERRFRVIGGDGETTSVAFGGRALSESRAEVAARLAALDPAGAPSLVRDDRGEMAGGIDDRDALAPPSELDTEIERWISNADAMIAAAIEGREGAAPVLCWPHHFDIAALITLERDADAEEARSINVGLSTGDGSCPEPYWYVTPWPRPEAGRLPSLPLGRWHTEGFCAAVLRGSMMPLSGDAQRDAAVRFLAAAIDACQDLLLP